MIAGNIHLWLDGTNMAFPNRCLAVVRSLLSAGSDSDKGRVELPKQMNFRKTSKKGGSFSIQQFTLQILDIDIGLFRTFSEKNCNTIFQK